MDTTGIESPFPRFELRYTGGVSVETAKAATATSTLRRVVDGCRTPES
jgi:hypothetical protein